MRWRVLYVLLFLCVSFLWFASIFDDAYAKAPLFAWESVGS
jgi:hypothetical protein